MDVREKLVELLTDNLPRIGNLPKCDNPLQYTMDEIVERIANHLIANGVTVQEWISVKDRLPSVKKAIDGEEYYKTVAVRVEGCEVEKIAYYDCEENRWYDTDDFPILEKVTHWYQLPEWNLPQPPKGE